MIFKSRRDSAAIAKLSTGRVVVGYSWREAIDFPMLVIDFPMLVRDFPMLVKVFPMLGACVTSLSLHTVSS